MLSGFRRLLTFGVATIGTEPAKLIAAAKRENVQISMVLTTHKHWYVLWQSTAPLTACRKRTVAKGEWSGSVIANAIDWV